MTNKTKTLTYLSVLSYPTIVAIPLIFIFAWPSMLNIMVGALFITILPMLLVFYHTKKHNLDFEVADHKKRARPFVYALISYLIGAVIFFAMHSQIMFTLSIAYFVVALVVAVISTKWKISVHCAGIAGAVTDVVYVFGVSLLPLFALIIAIAWIRLELRAHNIAQVIAGSILSIVLSFLVFWALYPIY